MRPFTLTLSSIQGSIVWSWYNWNDYINTINSLRTSWFSLTLPAKWSLRDLFLSHHLKLTYFHILYDTVFHIDFAKYQFARIKSYYSQPTLHQLTLYSQLIVSKPLYKYYFYWIYTSDPCCLLTYIDILMPYKYWRKFGFTLFKSIFTVDANFANSLFVIIHCIDAKIVTN